VHGALQAHACLGGAASAEAHLPNGMWVQEHLLSTDRRLASVAWDRTPRLSGSLHGHHPGLEPTGGKAPPGARSHGKLLLSLPHGHHPGLDHGRETTRGSIPWEATAKPTACITRDSSPREGRHHPGLDPMGSYCLAYRMGITRGSTTGGKPPGARSHGKLPLSLPHASPGTRAHGREGTTRGSIPWEATARSTKLGICTP